jgi:hypothetical protein
MQKKSETMPTSFRWGLLLLKLGQHAYQKEENFMLTEKGKLAEETKKDGGKTKQFLSSMSGADKMKVPVDV